MGNKLHESMNCNANNYGLPSSAFSRGGAEVSKKSDAGDKKSTADRKVMRCRSNELVGGLVAIFGGFNGCLWRFNDD